MKHRDLEQGQLLIKRLKDDSLINTINYYEYANIDVDKAYVFTQRMYMYNSGQNFDKDYQPCNI